MDTWQAFAMGEANRGKEMKVFDWEQAARIIKERGAQYASAGLKEDWDWTGDAIFAHGQPVPKAETYAYLASTWATPELCIDGEFIACYRMQSETPGWDSETYWTAEALAILGVDGAATVPQEK